MSPLFAFNTLAMIEILELPMLGSFEIFGSIGKAG
jgi:hypothetical protein